MNTTPRFRTGTVVWGSALLVIAAVSFSVAVFDLREFRADAVVWIVTGLGALFVVAAIVALIARTVSGNRAEPEVPTVEPELPASAASEPETPTKVGKSTGAAAKKGQPVD